MIEAVGIPKPKLFPSKGGNMALPQTPRPPPFNFKVYTVDCTLLTKHHVPLMHSTTPLVFIMGETPPKCMQIKSVWY